MYICIEGNIGAGKTTLAKALAKKLNATYLPEQFEENTLLPLFYKNKKKFAFPTEYSFLIDRHKQLTTFFKNKKSKKIVVSDYHFDKCYCFAKTNLTKNDFVYFKKHFNAIQKTVNKPDLIIYINTDINNAKENIKTRGREIEKNIDIEYLKKIKKTLDNYYITNNNSKTKTLILTINSYTKTTLEKLCKEVLTFLDLK